ncbi:hypothetical protein F0562_026242 [Nyssa sinensis]|uniref:BUB1 N-terminal domain-containing protein n=1 Tax=Nyssa sinensis TaxID=561372 RepID=A0A5J5BAP2_9ASTE|nr:hypothetical protein F0562_026242 [Nyssa sinensis]
MASSNSTLHNDLFSSLISDIKTYTGKDPLIPWLRGIRKMRDCLPPRLLKEKLPRFLQKCAQTFETDRRYSNDLRYLRVWLQLMDFVDDPRAVLRTMETNRIGTKRSLFYQAYALYYEKLKKFEEAEKMYHSGVQNLAEPIDELQKSYEQFLHRMKCHKNKRIQCQERRTANRPLSAGSCPRNIDETKENNQNICGVDDRPTGTWTKESLSETQRSCKNVENKSVLEESSWNEMAMSESIHTGVAVSSCDAELSRGASMKKGVMGDTGHGSYFKQQVGTEAESYEPSKFCSDDTVVVKFVDTAIVGKSRAEDACHHGLVEPTINTKEALNAINSMFREPLELAVVGRRSRRSQHKADQGLNNGFEVFVDENLDYEIGSSNQNVEKGCLLPQYNRSQIQQPLQEPLQIYIDDEENNEVKQRVNEKENLEKSKVQQLTEDAIISTSHVNAFVFPSPKDLPSELSDDVDAEKSPQARIREDTVVRRFVGSTISDEPEVENVCHHGLVEPTINLKEAMDDINSMFGKPIDFVRTQRSKKQDKEPARKNNYGGFVILPDDELDCEQKQSWPSSSAKNESDLFEPTVCSKEALDAINKMFGMPLDF